ncbi:hypothetical protein CERZMDRAFT_85871 [Cercospora zeae-maydis SCOH1-5]|uniref:Uncharacterized protein n=1 Tax=Cercospora zeae-maydis SCOH1-5 TaxID=717836 RepID=A0A6A6FCE9_9PEZI|nr:hypothetical protein CERZMDRAFT_85871 [Cercospora zeae-maydis SCOH1-5]
MADQHTYTPPTTALSPFLNLPGELRNIIYDCIAWDTEQLVIRNGKIVEHPLAQVNKQIRVEFSPVFLAILPSSSSTQIVDGTIQRFAPEKIIWQLQNFDFEQSIQVLERCIVTPNTKFDIQVRVTKQIQRDDWKKLWPWVQLCDALMPKAEFQGKTLASKYAVELECNRTCNPYAASHELYVETLPYILKGAGGPHGMFSGYEEIAKMRYALRNTVRREGR